MPKTMITIEKKELENKFNEMMLDLANSVLISAVTDDENEVFDYSIESFDEYEKDDFNAAFNDTRKKIRNIYIGQAQVLKEMIDFFGVYVNKTGHQMLSVMISTNTK